MSFDNETLTLDQAQSLRTSTKERHSRQIFYGWWVVLWSAVGLFWGVPISVYSFSVFFKPLMEEFHAGRAAVSLAYTLKLIAAALCAAPIGWLTDRYGPRRVILISTGIFGSLLLANRLFSGSIAQFYCFYVLLGFSVGGVGPIPYGSLVSHWFDRLRGLALGLTMLGIGLGAVIMPSLAQALIARFGWKTAYSILGASALLISGPVVGCLVKESPEELDLLGDGRTAKPNTIADVAHGLSTGSMAQPRFLAHGACFHSGQRECARVCGPHGTHAQ
jgi:MFS family permease